MEKNIQFKWSKTQTFLPQGCFVFLHPEAMINV